MERLKVNLFGNTFNHNIVNGLISSTPFKAPENIEFVTDNTGEFNLFVDEGIFEIDNILNDKLNFGWLLESYSIQPQLIKYFKEDDGQMISKFFKIYTHNLELINLDKKFSFLHPIGYWLNENIEIEKTKLVSMITSNKRHTFQAKIRYNFAKKFYKKIDIFGNGFHPIKYKELGLLPYYYSIVIENDITPDYFSEKILDCFAAKTIPIYLGCKNISKYFDINGIIPFESFNLTQLNSEFYYKNYESVKNNFELVKKYNPPENIIFSDYSKLRV